MYSIIYAQKRNQGVQMKNFKKFALLMLIIVVVASVAVFMVACDDEDDTVVTLKDYNKTIEATVGDEFAPVVTCTLSDGTTKDLTLLTNSAVVIKTDYKTTFDLVADEDDQDSLLFTKAGSYELEFTFCQDTYKVTIVVSEKEA